MKDKSYRVFPLGQESGHYLRAKRKRLTASSYRDYESCLDKLSRYFLDLELADLEPPLGTERLEEFLDAQSGDREGRTYNKNLSILRDFFKWRCFAESSMGIRPCQSSEPRSAMCIERRSRKISAIISAQESVRDRLAVQLLLSYGLRKGALRIAQFKHFDHYRKRLTIFTKGERVREVPIPDASFWDELGRLIIEDGARPEHYLLPRQKAIPKGKPPHRRSVIHRFPDKPMGEHGLHDWWYRCLARSGVVPAGTTRGERMHKARHTAGQRVLDASGNLKAVQKLLGHASIQTTADIYTDWDIEQLAETMRDVLAQDEV